jgi:hypothetical protein
MDDAPTTMTSFTSQLQAVAGVAFLPLRIEIYAEFQQGLNHFGTTFHHVADDLLITQSCSRSEGVLDVLFKGIFVGEYGGDAALGTARGRFRRRALGDNSHARFVGY